MAESVHHRLKRSQGGSWLPDNLMHVCGHGTAGCHGWIEAHPLAAADRGWWVSRLEELSRATELTFRGHRARWRLRMDGTLTWLYDV